MVVAEATLHGSGSFIVLPARKPEVPFPSVEGEAHHLYEDFLPTDVLSRTDRKAWFVVVDSRGRIRWTRKEDRGQHLLILAAQITPASYLAYLRQENIPYIIAGNERVDLHQAMVVLRTRLHVHRVLATSGGGLNGALLRAGLVDELHVVVIPALVGGRDTPTLFDTPDLEPRQAPVRLSLISAQAQPDGAIWLRYEVRQEG